jgi:peptidoglycan/LPS O-acetylase OafA/YrhL
MFFGSLLMLAVGAAPATHFGTAIRAGSLRTLGKYSYALYLFHLPLRALIRDTVYGPARFPAIAGSQLPGQLLFYAAGISLSLVAAWFSWHAYEKHFLKLKRFFPMRRAATGT